MVSEEIKALLDTFYNTFMVFFSFFTASGHHHHIHMEESSINILQNSSTDERKWGGFEMTWGWVK